MTGRGTPSPSRMQPMRNSKTKANVSFAETPRSGRSRSTSPPRRRNIFEAFFTSGDNGTPATPNTGGLPGGNPKDGAAGGAPPPPKGGAGAPPPGGNQGKPAKKDGAAATGATDKGVPKTPPRAKEDIAIRIRSAKTKITRRIGKAEHLLRYLQTNPLPSFLLLEKFRALHQSLEEALEECEFNYTEIAKVDPANSKLYEGNSEEQFNRCEKPLHVLLETIFRMEGQLRKEGVINGNMNLTGTGTPQPAAQPPPAANPPPQANPNPARQARAANPNPPQPQPQPAPGAGAVNLPPPPQRHVKPNLALKPDALTRVAPLALLSSSGKFHSKPRIFS